MALEYPPPLNEQLLVNQVDRRGKLIAQTVSKRWRRSLTNLWDTVRLLNAMQQKALIDSFDGLTGGEGAAVAWPVANLSFHIPFTLQAKKTIKRILAPIIVASGNVDVGIFNEAKVRLASSGSVKAMMDSYEQAFNITNLALDPGNYFMSMAVDNATLQAIRYARVGFYNRHHNVFEQTSAFPLPATATFREHATRFLIPSMMLDTYGGQISISLVGVSADATAASGNLSVTPPTTQTNHIMLCAVTANDNVALTFSAGWTIYREGNNTASMRVTLAWKRCTGAEGAFTITHPAGGFVRANVAVYSGCVATGSPINASSLRHESGGFSIIVTADAITPSVPNCLIVFTMHGPAATGSSAQVATDPASFTERIDNFGSGYAVSISDGYNLVGGSTGDATGTAGNVTFRTGGLTALTPMVK